MASIKTEPAVQEQAKPPTTLGSPNLEMLQGMLNMVLMTAGRFIKEHQAGGGTGRMRQGMQRAVPAASERFHDALDELENEVRLAQTVLRRDLALLKQDRKKREAAAKQHEVEKARLAAESRLSVPAKKEEEVVVKPESTTPAAQPEVLPPVEQTIKADSPEAAPKAEGSEPSQQPAASTSTAPPADPLFDGTPTNSNPQEHEFDFDFEFGDAMDTSGNHESTGDVMDTTGDMDFNLDEGSSLLRGLEDFAKSGNDDNNALGTNMDLDFPMPDLPDLSADSKPAVEQPKPAELIQQPPAQPDNTKDSEPVQEAAETKATTEANDANSNNNDEPMETMTTDNLEDLFNLDDYEDPEVGDSAFNDAFLSFD